MGRIRSRAGRPYRGGPPDHAARRAGELSVGAWLAALADVVVLRGIFTPWGQDMADGLA